MTVTLDSAGNYYINDKFEAVMEGAADTMLKWRVKFKRGDGQVFTSDEYTIPGEVEVTIDLIAWAKDFLVAKLPLVVAGSSEDTTGFGWLGLEVGENTFTEDCQVTEGAYTTQLDENGETVGVFLAIKQSYEDGDLGVNSVINKKGCRYLDTFGIISGVGAIGFAYKFYDREGTELSTTVQFTPWEKWSAYFDLSTLAAPAGTATIQIVTGGGTGFPGGTPPQNSEVIATYIVNNYRSETIAFYDPAGGWDTINFNDQQVSFNRSSEVNFISGKQPKSDRARIRSLQLVKNFEMSTTRAFKQSEIPFLEAFCRAMDYFMIIDGTIVRVYFDQLEAAIFTIGDSVQMAVSAKMYLDA